MSNQQIDLSQKTDIELKALGYDEQVKKNLAENNLNMINAALVNFYKKTITPEPTQEVDLELTGEVI